MPKAAHTQSSAHARQSPEKVPSSHLWLILRLQRQGAKTKAEMQLAGLSSEDIAQTHTKPLGK